MDRYLALFVSLFIIFLIHQPPIGRSSSFFPMLRSSCPVDTQMWGEMLTWETSADGSTLLTPSFTLHTICVDMEPASANIGRLVLHMCLHCVCETWISYSLHHDCHGLELWPFIFYGARPTIRGCFVVSCVLSVDDIYYFESPDCGTLKVYQHPIVNALVY